MLSAHGDLQRLFSAFFAHPISIQRVYCDTRPFNELEPASPSHSITQERQVKLTCANKTVCVATSFVTITSQECKKLFLDESYTIGQVFRQLHKVPEFVLLDVGADKQNGKRQLWRKYRLSTEGFACEIREVFPDRDMFVLGEAWLDGGLSTPEKGIEEPWSRAHLSSAVDFVAGRA